MARIEYVEVERSKHFARCLKPGCGFSGERSRFRLTQPEVKGQGGGLFKEVRHFDGVYRCPYCGTPGPRQFTETVTELQRRVDA